MCVCVVGGRGECGVCVVGGCVSGGGARGNNYTYRNYYVKINVKCR